MEFLIIRYTSNWNFVSCNGLAWLILISVVYSRYRLLVPAVYNYIAVSFFNFVSPLFEMMVWLNYNY